MQDSKFQITPTPKQSEFITSNAKFSCFSGGFGNGKTTGGCLRGLLLSGSPGNVGLIGRLSYPELRDTTRKAFFEICPPDYYDSTRGGEWKISENYLKLVNGSEIIFRHLDDISEKELLSLNLGWFFIDQAEEISEKVFMILQSRLRLGRVPNRYGFIACNPEPGNWIHKMFKQPKDQGTLQDDYDLVEASTYENKQNLPPDYIPTLIKSFPEEMIKRYVEGLWEVFEGQVFTEYDPRVHIIKPFDIPSGWEKLVAIDHGMVNPTAALWGAIDYDNNCVAPKTKILSKDLNWVEAGMIKEGDILAGFDEQIPITKKRRWKESVVESVKRIIKPSYKITLSDGTIITCSADHQWLIQMMGNRRQWRATEELKDDWKLMRVSDVWEEDTSYSAGYLAAAFDGEGSFGINQRGTMRLSFVQCNNDMMKTVEQELKQRGYRYGVYKRKIDNCNNLSLTRKRDILRFLGSIRPKRLFPKFGINNLKGFSAFTHPTVIKKEFVGMTEVVAIQTSTRTYIAEGIASHNCIIYDEYYSPGIVSNHAKTILEQTGDQEISMWLIDPSTAAKTREKDGMLWSVMEEYEDYGIYAIPANNEKLAGINRVREFMRIDLDKKHFQTGQNGAPKLYIFSSCINLISEIPQYQWRKLRSMTPRNAPEVPRDLNDHACFCQHTEVLTQRGTLAIIDVKKNDKVWTPLGWSKVIQKERTGVKRVITFRSTKATGNHPFLTQDGFLPLKDLKGTDKLWNVFTSADEHTGVIQIHQDFPMQSIFAVVGRKMESEQVRFISMYGNSLKGVFLKSAIFTIKIVTMIIMLLRIWKFTILPYILSYIEKQIVRMENEILKLREDMPFYGIKVRLVGNFTNGLEKNHGRTKNLILEYAKTVRKSTELMIKTPLIPNSAVLIAKCQCSAETEVYNLVTDTGMYTANNAIVSNCDALRYMIMSRFPAPSRRKIGDAMISLIERKTSDDMAKSFPRVKETDPILGEYGGGLGSLESYNGEDFAS